VGIFLGTGGASIISRALGARENAEKVLGNLFTLNLIIDVFLAVFCIHYLDPILKIFGATAGVFCFPSLCFSGYTGFSKKVFFKIKCRIRNCR
jgi:Na+-driven multidrug efflux pump